MLVARLPPHAPPTLLWIGVYYGAAAPPCWICGGAIHLSTTSVRLHLYLGAGRRQISTITRGVKGPIMPSACATGQSACPDCPVPPLPIPSPYAELHRPWCPRDPVAQTARDHASRPMPCPCAPHTTQSRPALRPAVPTPLRTVRPCARPFLHHSEPSGPAPGRSRTTQNRPALRPAVPAPLVTVRPCDRPFPHQCHDVGPSGPAPGRPHTTAHPS